METYDLYFMRLTADYSHDTVDSSKFALSQHGAYELYDYVNTLDTSVCNAIDTANSSITVLKGVATSLNSSINAVNSSVNAYAKWDRKAYNVLYDAGDGKGTMAMSSFTFGEMQKLKKKFTMQKQITSLMTL